MDVNKSVISANEIIPGIWVGNEAAALSNDYLNSINADVIVNCTKTIAFANNKKINIRIPVNDPGEASIDQEDIAKMYKLLPTIVKIIHTYRLQNKNVFIHCHAGMQRSAAVMAAYLITETDCNLPRAVNLIVSKRPIAFAGGTYISFREALIRYSESLNKSKK